MFRNVTGLRCPGCGMGSATHALLHGHLGTAIHLHLLVVPFHLFVFVAWASVLVRGERAFLFHAQPVGPWVGALFASMGMALALANIA
jgi:hypothetical protein